eukprot:6486299-Amphidinium_carterae.1
MGVITAISPIVVTQTTSDVMSTHAKPVVGFQRASRRCLGCCLSRGASFSVMPVRLIATGKFWAVPLCSAQLIAPR